MAKIGVYGANGFIGRRLLSRLASTGYDVRAISRSIDPSLLQMHPNNVEFVEADLNDSDAIFRSLTGLDVVVQLISSSSPALGNRHTVADLESGVLPHVRFLSEVVRANIRQFVFASSGGTVYGPAAVSPIPETYLPAPVSSYGMTKLTVENYIQMAGRTDGLNYTILRIGNPFGPGQIFKRGQGLIPALLELHKRKEAATIIGDGESRRDYLFVDDLIDAFLCAILEKDAYGQVFNVGSGQSKSINDVIYALESFLGESISRKYSPDRNNYVDTNELDISKIREFLGWKPNITFNDGIKRTVAHFLDSCRLEPGVNV